MKSLEPEAERELGERLELLGAGGMRLAASAFGDPRSPVVLLLHGGGQTRHSWTATAEALAAKGWRAITVDARGHGDSSRDAERRYRMSDFADDLETILDALPTPPAIVGASLGGCMGLLVAGHRKRSLAALVLVDVAPHVEAAGIQRIKSFMLAQPEGFASLEEAADVIASYLPHRRRPKDVEGLRKNLRREADGRYRWHWDPAFLEVMFQPQPGTGEALLAASRSLSVPTMLIRGKMSDVLSESGAKAFLEMAPHARYVDISDAGHMVAGDRNDAFTSAVVGFLRDVVSRS